MTERVRLLCRSLASDEELSAALPDAPWDAVADAVRRGAGLDVLSPLLDAVEESAAAIGIDGLTTADRRFEPLPDANPGVRSVPGWRCPHPDPCGHVALPGDGTSPVCALTADRLAAVTVVSG